MRIYVLGLAPTTRKFNLARLGLTQILSVSSKINLWIVFVFTVKMSSQAVLKFILDFSSKILTHWGVRLSE